MSNFLLKLKLVIWKNFIIRKRHWILSLFEIVIPVLIYIFLAYSQTLFPEYHKEFINTTINNEVFTLDDNRQMALFYAPNNQNPNINLLINKASENFQTTSMRGFTSEKYMLDYITSLYKNDSFYIQNIVGVVFDNFPKTAWPLPLQYRIRTNMYSDFSSLFPLSSFPFMSSDKNEYFSTIFMNVQHAVDNAFIELVSKKNLNYTLTLQEMPYPPHETLNMLSSLFLTVLPFCTILAFIFLFPSVLKRVIEEKSAGIKELMKMMGLESWMVWLGWFIHAMVTNIVAITFIVIMLKVGISSDTKPIIQYGDGTVIWVFLFLYCSSGICFSFFISTLFKRPTLGMCFGMLLWTCTLLVVNPLISNNDPTSYATLRSFIMILPNACLAYGFKAFSDYEIAEVGLTWSNMFQRSNQYSPHPTMGAALLMLIADCLILLIITWYIDNVYPGEYGLSRRWYFPFTKSYWCTNKVTHDETNEDQLIDSDKIESVTDDLNAGIQIRNLHKKFRGKKAVNGLSLDIYTNQITVLLGHNGAGKTTTMNIITGMLGASSGSVVVNGYNITTNLNKVRESLGLCPQHNLQFPDLTVLEHLKFFAMLKGRSSDEATTESHEFLTRLNLTSKANKLASELSGGMRRKLSLGMALVGHTKVLMLDEPTSGMDPEARREIWDFLLGMRGERTILITTHYMEEADILGDRIAIMHNGQLMCYGTSLFLKKHYGTGYTLSILTANSWDINTLTAAIQTFVPSATVKSISVGCVNFVLPTNDTTSLSKLFLSMEKNKDSLGMSSFGVSVTTMEDVFLKVGELADEVDKSNNSKQSDTDSRTYLLTDNSLDDPDKDKIKSEYHLAWQHFVALFVKRCRYSVHRWLLFLLQALIPIAMGLFLMLIMKLQSSNSNTDVKRELTLGQYANAKSFYSTTPDTEELGKSYMNAVKAQKAIAEKVKDVSDAIINVGELDLDKYHNTLITAAEFNSTNNMLTVNAMYGNWALHGPAISLNLISNAILKYFTGDDNWSIIVTNNPLPSPYASTPESLNATAVMIWMFQFPVAFTIMIGFFLAFPQGERFTGVKHLQLMAGVSRPLYWLSNYIFDLIVYSVVSILIVIILVGFDNGGQFGNSNAILALMCMLILNGFATLPFAYLFTYRPTAASSMTVILWIQILLGTIGSVVIFVLENLSSKYKAMTTAFTYILLFIPNFAFSDGMFKFTNHAREIYSWNHLDDKNKEMRCKYDDQPCCIPDSSKCAEFNSFYAGDHSISKNVIFLTVHIIIYSALLMLFDSGLPRKWFDMLFDMKNDKESVDNNLDHDVAEEKKRISAQINESARLPSAKERAERIQDVLLVSNLRKWFRKFYAVRGLNFGVKKSECFGLLGINGAGKTTTFKMLTGEIFPTTGTANLMGYILEKNKTDYLRKVGYCPQFDALNLTLTCREMLTLFAQIRGIKKDKIDRHVSRWIHKFDIKQYENMQCGKLSGGNKRKLSTALALIGDPALIMLDEPTSGVDPVARRNLWDILAVIRKSGQSIVLTSHSMDECEALCDRLAIMVDGQMKCIGNIQYLKSKFGQGFTVMVKLRTVVSTAGDTVDSESPIRSLKNSIENKYTCTLKDEHKGMVLYHVTNPDASLGEIFNFMEGVKKSQDIVEDYAVSDTSLEQVFLSFAKAKDSKTEVSITNAVV